MDDIFGNLLVQVGGYAGLAVLVMTIADRVAKLTPTTSDDKVVQWVRKIAKAIAADVPDKQ